MMAVTEEHSQYITELNIQLYDPVILFLEIKEETYFHAKTFYMNIHGIAKTEENGFQRVFLFFVLKKGL